MSSVKMYVSFILEKSIEENLSICNRTSYVISETVFSSYHAY